MNPMKPMMEFRIEKEIDKFKNKNEGYKTQQTDNPPGCIEKT